MSSDVTFFVNSRLCVLVLCVLAVSHIVIVAVYYKEPVQCFCPAHFPDTWCDVAKMHCAAMPETAMVVYEDEETVLDEPTYSSTSQYYTHISLILLLQALLFYLPSVVWKELARNVGLVPEEFASTAQSILKCKSKDEKEFCIMNTATGLETFCTRQMRRRHLSFFTTYFKGNKLILAQFVCKIIYVVNVIGQFYLLDAFLHKPFHQLGWELIRFDGIHFGFVNNTTELESNGTEIKNILPISPNVFETSMLCDVTILIMGNVHKYSIHCFYFVNNLNEFIFKFVWFLLFAAFIVTMSSLIWELFKILAFPCRRMGIRERLQDVGALERNDPRDTDIVKKINRFEKIFLQRDGLLLLRYVERAAGDIVTDEILGALWKLYDSKYPDHEQIFKPVKWTEEAIGDSEMIQEHNASIRNTRYRCRIESAVMAIPMSPQDETEGQEMEEPPPAYKYVEEKQDVQKDIVMDSL